MFYFAFFIRIDNKCLWNTELKVYVKLIWLKSRIQELNIRFYKNKERNKHIMLSKSKLYFNITDIYNIFADAIVCYYIWLLLVGTVINWFDMLQSISTLWTCLRFMHRKAIESPIHYHCMWHQPLHWWFIGLCIKIMIETRVVSKIIVDL